MNFGIKETALKENNILFCITIIERNNMDTISELLYFEQESGNFEKLYIQLKYK